MTNLTKKFSILKHTQCKKEINIDDRLSAVPSKISVGKFAKKNNESPKKVPLIEVIQQLSLDQITHVHVDSSNCQEFIYNVYSGKNKQN